VPGVAPRDAASNARTDRGERLKPARNPVELLSVEHASGEERHVKVNRSVWSQSSGWTHEDGGAASGDVDLVLVFGCTAAMIASRLPEIRGRYPNAYVCGSSTAGEIVGKEVRDDSVVVTAIELEKTELRAAEVTIDDADDSLAAGRQLASNIPHAGLVHTFVLSDGLFVNGTDLIRGLCRELPAGVATTGGRSGDGERFARTYVCAGDSVAERRSVLLGFYSDHLRVGYSSVGGWDPFGPERRITRASRNVLYELDGQSALELYKRYLGEHAKNLPASGLMFPLTVRDPITGESVTRAVVGINDSEQSMIFAGDVPEGSFVRLMHANFDRLVDGACAAGRASQQMLGVPAELGILISCIGRKQLLKQRVEEEVEGVIEALGPETHTTGFYAYGELSPAAPGAPCTLQNQSMSVTLFSEI
jgi:hypothetical protein